MLIIASIGQNTTEQKARKIILAGANVVRINFSRRNINENIEYVKIIQGVINDLNSQTKILIDLPINKARLGDFDGKTFSVREGEEFICKSASYSPDCNQFIPIQIPRLGDELVVDQTVTIGDGEIALQVIEIIDESTVKVKILNNGIIQYLKTLNTGHRINTTNTIEQYRQIIDRVKEHNPDYYAFSYVNQETNEEIKKLFKFKVDNSYPKIIIKIENQKGVDDIKEIVQDKFYDYVLIDRGEMGVNTPFEQTGIQQKILLENTRKYGKPTIVSTQILESTIHNYTPTRSDILDLTNIVLDGASGIMFCRETGFESRPAYTISVAKKIISATEKYRTETGKKDKLYYDFEAYSGM